MINAISTWNTLFTLQYIVLYLIYKLANCELLFLLWNPRAHARVSILFFSSLFYSLLGYQAVYQDTFICFQTSKRTVVIDCLNLYQFYSILATTSNFAGQLPLSVPSVRKSPSFIACIFFNVYPGHFRDFFRTFQYDLVGFRVNCVNNCIIHFVVLLFLFFYSANCSRNSFTSSSDPSSTFSLFGLSL